MASLPPVQIPTAMMPTNPLEAVIAGINTNPYFIGLMMLLLNLGGRFLGLEISKEQERFFQHPWVRRALFFTVLFVATRNIMVALVMTIFVVLFMSILFNENSSFYLGKSLSPSEETIAKDETAGPAPGLTPEEQEILRRLTEKQARLNGGAQPGSQLPMDGVKEIPKPMGLEQIYMKNIARLNA
jgi:hypothetical protein